MKIIELRDLSKNYKVPVLNNLNYEFFSKKIYLIVGDNGSGKTTLIKLILGLINPSYGHVYKNSIDISYVPDVLAFPEFLTVFNFLYNLGLIYNIKKDNIENIIKEELIYWGLNGNFRLKELSKGMKQKVLIIQAFLKNGSIFVFDEPLSGLDNVIKKKFIVKINELKARGKTIFIITHLINEFKDISDYILKIENGSLNEEFT